MSGLRRIELIGGLDSECDTGREPRKDGVTLRLCFMGSYGAFLVARSSTDLGHAMGVEFGSTTA